MASPCGYDCKFISEPDDALKCLICLAVARDPRQHEECGKLLCSECIEKYGTGKPCPNCKQTEAHFYKDHRGKRDIVELKVKCDNVERDCTWVGTVGTLEKHVAMCKFTLLPCPKECKDDSDKVKQLMRKDLDKHLKEDCPNRDYSCKDCGEKGTYASIINIHDPIFCPKKPVPCPNDCGSNMERQHVSKHLATECELTVIACKYKRLGCDRESKRNDMAAHEEDDKLHLRMAMDTTVKLESKTVELEKKSIEFEKKTVELEKKTVELEHALRVLRNGEPLKFKVTSFNQKKANNECVQSPSYYTSPNGYHMALKVYANGWGDGEGTHVSVFATFLKGKYDAQLKWPFVGKITFTLLNQLRNSHHHKMTLTITAASDLHVGGYWGYPQLILYPALDYDAVNNTQYLKDDTLYFRMSVIPADQDKPWLQ